jgi:hypothetical protein
MKSTYVRGELAVSREEVYEPMEWIPTLSWGHITHYNLTASNRAW